MNSQFQHHGPLDLSGGGTAASSDTPITETDLGTVLQDGNGSGDFPGLATAGGLLVPTPVPARTAAMVPSGPVTEATTATASGVAAQTVSVVTTSALTTSTVTTGTVTAGTVTAGTVTTGTLTTGAASSGFQIIPIWDKSVTTLDVPGNAADMEIYNGFTNAVTSAIDFFESHFTNSATLTINFGYGEVAGQTVASLGASSTDLFPVSYYDLYNALETVDTTSAVQIAAFKSLSSIDPTGGAGSFEITSSEATILGVDAEYSGASTSIGISSADSYDWNQQNFTSDEYDAVAIFEHEISETLGRIDSNGETNDTYMPMDLFKYASPGVPDEPFATNYSATANSYFSYNGTTMGLEYDTPTQVSEGEDIADWAGTTDDAFNGSIAPGAAIPVSATDLQVMNVLGYDEVTCYLAGTRVETDRGEVAVEALAEGDLLRTVSGELRELRWIGTRVFGGRFAARNPGARPILIRVGALAENTPIRDLCVSPNHAMLLDGVLVPAGKLVNGVTIVRAEPMDRIEYFHLELDTHDVIFAEGAASETFVDDDSRMMFHNAASFAQMYPAAGKVPAIYCAPRVSGGFALEAISQRLAERAGLRMARTEKPLRGFVDGVRFDTARGWIVEGWARGGDESNAPVCLDILLDGEPVTSVLANRFRADLLEAGVGRGRHGFSARLPGMGAPMGRLAVRRSSDGATLKMGEAFYTAA